MGDLPVIAGTVYAFSGIFLLHISSKLICLFLTIVRQNSQRAVPFLGVPVLTHRRLETQVRNEENLMTIELKANAPEEALRVQMVDGNRRQNTKR